jgi:DivIVA domain-containing protein
VTNDMRSLDPPEPTDVLDDVLDRGPDEVEHVVRFESAVRGYRKADVDAYVTQVENRLTTYREKAAGLEGRLHEAEWRAEQAERAALKWKQKFEESAPPFEELGAHVAEMLASAEQEARARKEHGEAQAIEAARIGQRRTEEIIALAEERARQIEAEAQAKADELEREYDRLLDMIEDVRTVLRTLPTRTVAPQD